MFSSITETDFIDASGAITRISFRLEEQDTFRANGKTLTGEPYDAMVDFVFDSTGNVTHIFGQGVTERVVLPEGRLSREPPWPNDVSRLECSGQLILREGASPC